MKNNQISTGCVPADPAPTLPLIPVDRELQEILMTTHTCRCRLQAYVESIHNRQLHEMVRDSADTARSDLVNAITAMSQLAANQIAFRLTETD